MFTGIIETFGEVLATQDGDRSRRVTIRNQHVTLDLPVGSSIAVDGVCLTVVKAADDCFSVDLGPETVRCTTLGTLPVGARVNLERPLRLDQRLGGHLVQGHVDGIGTVLRVQIEDTSRWMEVAVLEELLANVVEKGSVALDGVSLTVARLTAEGLAVSLIPHTLAVTTLGAKHVGDVVNIEVDIVGKYVQRLVAAHLSDK